MVADPDLDILKKNDLLTDFDEIQFNGKSQKLTFFSFQVGINFISSMRGNEILEFVTVCCTLRTFVNYF